MDWIDDTRYWFDIPEEFYKCKVCGSRLNNISVHGISGQQPDHYFEYDCELELRKTYGVSKNKPHVKNPCANEKSESEELYQ